MGLIDSIVRKLNSVETLQCRSSLGQIKLLPDLAQADRLHAVQERKNTSFQNIRCKLQRFCPCLISSPRCQGSLPSVPDPVTEFTAITCASLYMSQTGELLRLQKR